MLFLFPDCGTPIFCSCGWWCGCGRVRRDQSSHLYLVIFIIAPSLCHTTHRYFIKMQNRAERSAAAPAAPRSEENRREWRRWLRLWVQNVFISDSCSASGARARWEARSAISKEPPSSLVAVRHQSAPRGTPVVMISNTGARCGTPLHCLDLSRHYFW